MSGTGMGQICRDGGMGRRGMEIGWRRGRGHGNGIGMGTMATGIKWGWGKVETLGMGWV